jgi:hypothetical protein
MEQEQLDNTGKVFFGKKGKSVEYLFLHFESEHKEISS